MFKGLTCLVTGAASGLGRAVATRVAAQNGNAVIFDLAKSDGENVAKSLGKNALFTPGNVTSEEDVLKSLDKLENKFGRLDVVVNCAGIACAFKTYNFNKGKPHLLEDFSRVVTVNVMGTFNVIRLSAGLLGKNEPNSDGYRGCVVNTSSVAAYDGQMGQVAYAASKGAIASMTLPLARDFASE